MVLAKVGDQNVHKPALQMQDLRNIFENPKNNLPEVKPVVKVQNKPVQPVVAPKKPAQPAVIIRKQPVALAKVQNKPVQLMAAPEKPMVPVKAVFQNKAGQNEKIKNLIIHFNKK
jgi:hypothetical protein